MSQISSTFFFCEFIHTFNSRSHQTLLTAQTSPKSNFIFVTSSSGGACLWDWGEFTLCLPGIWVNEPFKQSNSFCKTPTGILETDRQTERQMEGMSPQRGKNTNRRQWEKYFKITNKASESCCEPRTFAGIIRVHWLQSTLALSQMAPTTIHLLFWFICWYIVESNTSFSHFLFVLAGLRHLHLDFWARELHPHTQTQAWSLNANQF